MLAPQPDRPSGVLVPGFTSPTTILPTREGTNFTLQLVPPELRHTSRFLWQGRDCTIAHQFKRGQRAPELLWGQSYASTPPLSPRFGTGAVQAISGPPTSAARWPG
ncbi:hypothetical protein NDU88_004606 [Pleurodeles waltl]|uniref:Uncharacterized protein n=1 Tax=Pleurodeles waltl TaxID=8319 RepID=A0AAV7QIX0_PLEWA|nr:hypothetical protein NDU88_004606 [Pleurodeles waltl]